MNQKLKVSEVMTVEETARFLRVPKKAVEELAAAGKMPARRVNGQWRFLKAAIEEWLRGRERPNSREAFLRVFGVFKDDETLDELLANIYKARGRPEVDDAGKR
jgi:excisionase family DNA binding protein